MTDGATRADDGGPADRTGQDGPVLPATIDFRAMHGELSALFGKQLFFIGGAAKSGTTWLQVLLDAHPSVSCTGENHFVTHLFPTLRKASMPLSRWDFSCAAESCVRMRACPFATTGKKNPTT